MARRLCCSCSSCGGLLLCRNITLEFWETNTYWPAVPLVRCVVVRELRLHPENPIFNTASCCCCCFASCSCSWPAALGPAGMVCIVSYSYMVLLLSCNAAGVAVWTTRCQMAETRPPRSLQAYPPKPQPVDAVWGPALLAGT